MIIVVTVIIQVIMVVMMIMMELITKFNYILYLFTCQLNRPKANYTVSIVINEKTKQEKKQTK
jgi:hypothetical protein